MPMTNDGSINGSGHKPTGEDMDLVSSHQRLLIGAAMRTTGRILELGVGWYSTPLLHEIAVTQKRMLWTVDNNDHWLAQFKNLVHDYHALTLVGWWGELWNTLDNERYKQDRFGLVFVDNGQPCEREYAVRALLDKADVFVLHDTEEGPAYGYNRVLGSLTHIMNNLPGPMFKYQWTDKCQKAWTTVASNTVDVTQWFRDLPPCEPSVEIT